MNSKRIFSALLCIMCAVVLFPISAFAKEDMVLTKDVTLTIQYRYERAAVPDIPFKIYRIADVSEKDTVFTLTSKFEKYPVKVNDLDAEGWSMLAETLTGYVQRDNVRSLCSGKTDSKGELVFPNGGVEMKPGLYLVTSSKTDVGDYTYTTKPFLVCLPGENEDDSWNYQVTVQPKCTRVPLPEPPDDPPGNPPSNPPSDGNKITRKALKVWKDSGHKKVRPTEITVQLLRDGTVYDTQKLNAKNQWRYTWNDLSDKYEWRLVEKKVKNYYTLVSQEGITFVVTNTYTEEIPDDPPPLTRIPQTGTTWYLVPIFACAGLFFLVIGLWCRKKDE